MCGACRYMSAGALARQVKSADVIEPEDPEEAVPQLLTG